MTSYDIGKIRSIAWQSTLIVAASGGVVWLLYALRMVLLLLAFTVLFCYLVLPLVNFLNRPRRLVSLPRSVSILLVYLGLAGVVFLIFEQIIPLLADQFTALLDSIPGYARRFDQTIKWLASLPARYRLPLGWRTTLGDMINSMPLRLFDWLQAVASQTFGLSLYLSWLILIPVIGFFFIKDVSGLHSRLISSFPEGDVRIRIAAFLQDVSQTLAAYIRAQVLACLLVALIEGSAFWLLGISYPLILGFAAGLLEFIPVIGPAILFIAAVMIASLDSWQTGLIIAIFLLVFRAIHDYVIYPRLVSEGVKIHPVVVILAVVCGAEIGGMVGVFLSVPVAALLLVCIRHWRTLTFTPARIGDRG
ncbi:MAG: putative permease [Acidobacteriota bacterium]|jgi:predicted PurR-regulated permease PerM